MVQAFFWDYDNTLFETAEAHWNKHKTVLGKHGIVLADTYKKRVYENNGNQNWEWMRAELGLQVAQKDYLREIDDAFHRKMLLLAMRPGVDEVMAFLESLQIPQAIITNARRASAEPILKHNEILSKMAFILYKEDYEGRKPEPAPYIAGIDRMSKTLGNTVDPKQCVAVEDDPKGVESAHRAGLVVIHRKLLENEPDCPFADYSCHSKNDFIRIVASLFL